MNDKKTGWVKVPSFIGKKGFVDGEPFTVTEHGSLPEGWTDEKPVIPSTFEEARAVKFAEIMSAYNEVFKVVEKDYPQAEREGWAVQEAEAEAVLADPQAETPVLSILVTQRGLGETVQELAEKVLENAAQWRFIYATYTGQQQKMYAEIAKATQLDFINNYKVQFINS